VTVVRHVVGRLVTGESLLLFVARDEPRAAFPAELDLMSLAVFWSLGNCIDEYARHPFLTADTS